MKLPVFNVTYDIVSQESAEIGDFAESGFVCEAVRLRDAIKAVNATRTCHVGGVEAIESDSMQRHVTVSNSMEFLTGDYESRSLHIPQTVTKASARRILRLAGARA